MLGLDTSYMHTKNGCMVTGPSLHEVAEGTPVHALAVTLRSQIKHSIINLKDYGECTQFLKMKHTTLLKKSALQQFDHSCRRLPDGSYSVTLPRKRPTPTLVESRTIALNRLHSTERSLFRKGQEDVFTNAMLEYLSLQHAGLVAK